MTQSLEKNILKKTTKKATKLGLGGATFGNVLADGIFGGVSKFDSIKIIRKALDLGINFFDTAPFYGSGKSEARYGEALNDSNREDIIISSKCGRLLQDQKNVGKKIVNSTDVERGNIIAFFDYSEDGIRRSLEESLERLNVQYLDILLLHDADQGGLEKQALEIAFPTMFKLRDEGLVKCLGCGMNEWEMPNRFIKAFPLDIILLAGRYTLLENSSSKRFLDNCLKQNIQIIIGGPYNSGILARDLNQDVAYDYEIAPSNIVEKAKRIEQITRRYGISLKTAALQFVMRNPAIISVVPGTSNIKELQENLTASTEIIPETMWEELKNEKYIS